MRNRSWGVHRASNRFGIVPRHLERLRSLAGWKAYQLGGGLMESISGETIGVRGSGFASEEEAIRIDSDWHPSGGLE
jgi:hypothetical protein